MNKRILSIILAAVLLFAAFGTAACAEEENGNVYYVYTDNGKPLNVRNAPNGDIVGSLPGGSKVEVMSFNSDNWAMITFHYDNSGSGMGDWPAYVNRRYLIKVEPEVLTKAIESEESTGDPMADIYNEFAHAVSVEPYKITVRPARVTGWVSMRWIPSETGAVIARYKATEELLVLKELEDYLQVQDPDTGDVGYIHKKFAAR